MTNEKFTDEDIRVLILKAAAESEWFTTKDVLRAAGFDDRHKSRNKNPVAHGLYHQRIYAVLRREFADNYRRMSTKRAVYKIEGGV